MYFFEEMASFLDGNRPSYIPVPTPDNPFAYIVTREFHGTNRFSYISGLFGQERDKNKNVSPASFVNHDFKMSSPQQ